MVLTFGNLWEFGRSGPSLTMGQSFTSKWLPLSLSVFYWQFQYWWRGLGKLWAKKQIQQSTKEIRMKKMQVPVLKRRPHGVCGMRKLWTPTGTISCFGVFALCFPNILFTLVACSIDCKLLCFVYQTNMFSRFCATGFSSSILWEPPSLYPFFVMPGVYRPYLFLTFWHMTQGMSLASLQTFMCRRIYNTTYLIADYREECPWGGLDLDMYRLDTW